MRRLVAAAIALAAITGCSANANATQAHTPTASATVSDYTRNQAFLKVVKTDTRDLPDVALVEVGHIICKQIARDPKPDIATWVDEVKALVATDFTGHQAGVMIGAATAAYCPQYAHIAP